jgi:transposase
MSTLGIDISKANFHAHLISDRGDGKKSFPNTEVGFKQLTNWLKNRDAGEVWACMEATGGYGDALAIYLHETGHRVSVVNPLRIKAYAQSKLLRTKTDSVDAALIAQFARTENPPIWEPPAPEILLLQALARHLEDLKATRTQELNRVQTPGLPVMVMDSIKELIAALDAQIEQVERAISDHIDRHRDLKKRRDLLTSIPGIADATAAQILAEAPQLDQFRNAGAVAAFAGLSPRLRQSGSSVRSKGHLCKTGNARLRKALFLPALAAMRFNPLLKTFADRLRAAGKPKMVIVGAVMRKLLVLAYGVLKSGREFSPEAPVRA